MLVLPKKDWLNRLQRLQDIRVRLVNVYAEDPNYKFWYFKKDMQRIAKLINRVEKSYTWN